MTYFKLLILIVVFGTSTLASQARAQDVPATDFRYQPDWESIRSRYRCPKWFRDAKFGIFVFWGPASVPAVSDDKYGMWMYRKGATRLGINVGNYHRLHFGPPSKFGYKDFFPMFQMEKFDPVQWTALFKQSGARYVVPVAEMHDGYAMYASKHTRWNVVDVGPKKDVMRLLVDEIRKTGMKLGLSSHFALNREYYSKSIPNADTNDPRYQDLYGKPVDPKAPPTQEFLGQWWNRTTDIVQQYQPDLLWFDFGLDKPGFESVHQKILAYYYNKGLEWNKEVVFQDKNMKGNSFPEDLIVLDLERGRMSDINPQPWQTDTAVGKMSWTYVHNENYKTSDYLIDEMVDIVSKNGCFLLSIGPKADGTIGENETRILKDFGVWLKINGEAIYDTRPWKIYGEGPTQISTGHHSEHKNKDSVAADIRFTTKNDTLYAVSLGWPENGEFSIKSLAKGNPYEKREIESIQFISANAEAEWTQTDECLSIRTTEGAPCQAAYAFRIEFKH